MANSNANTRMSENHPPSSDQTANTTPTESSAPPADQQQAALEWKQAIEALPKAKDVLELTSKMVLGLVGISYALGLLIMNLYLYQYGVYSLNLLRLNYVIAGFWALVPVIFWSFITFNVTWLLLYYSKKFCAFYRFPPPPDGPLTPDDKKFIRIQVIYVSIPIIATIVILQLTVGFRLSWLQPLALAGLLSWSLVNLSLASIIVHRATLPRVYMRIFSISFLLLATGAYVLAFAINIYGSIHSSFGGGAPKEVIIVFTEDAETKKLLDIAGFSFFPDSKQMAAARVLFATEEEYILLPTDRNISLSVPRNSVKAVFYSVKIETQR